MGVYYNLDENKNSALALGFFDGVHYAHRILIEKTVECAKKCGIKSVLITFQKSPYSILHKEKGVYITKIEDKIKLIKQSGIDDIYFLDFREFMHLDANEYIKDVLIKYFSPKFIVTGFNHTFGHDRAGTSGLLASYPSLFKYIEIPPVSIDNILVSSTNIKKAIKEGEFSLANKMLGRNFSIKGVVVEGQKIARSLGYKTANIIWDNDIIKPLYGVYSGLATYKGITYQAMINFGIRPSIDKFQRETLEVHLIGFEGDLYGETIEVEFVSRLRNEIRFSSVEELKKQLNEDCLAVKKFPIA